MPKHEPGGCFVQAFPNYCVLTGRESSGPASRGFAQLEPRRRNDRQIISLAANTQVGQKRFLPTFSRLKKQVAARHRAKGSRRLSADIPAHTCGEVWPQSGIEHPMHGCLRPHPLTRASKDAKRPFPRRQAGYALRRPRRRRTSYGEHCPPHTGRQQKISFCADMSGGGHPGVGRPASADRP